MFESLMPTESTTKELYADPGLKTVHHAEVKLRRLEVRGQWTIVHFEIVKLKGFSLL